jgi:serine phosphatase RsbU (regulator of sigma subunit)
MIIWSEEGQMITDTEHTNGREEIAIRAYENWRRRGRTNEVQDWLDAEVEILQVRELTRRVTALEAKNKAEQKTSLSRELAEFESRLASVTAQHVQAERRLTAENSVTRYLAGSVEFGDAASAILQAICESLDWDVGVFWMVDCDANALRCVELWHKRDVEVSAFEHVSRRRSFSSGIGLPGRIWASGSPAWVPDVTQDTNFPDAAIAAETGLRAAVGFPILNGVEFIAIMEFFSREIRQLDEELMAMMCRVVSNISNSIARRRTDDLLQQHEQERRVARKIQEGLLPKSMPAPTGLSIGGRSSPSHMVGGDYFDFFPMTDGCLGIVIGDASGHGIGPALIIAETRAYLRALALTSTDLGAILALTNRRLVEDLRDSGNFVTLLLARLDTGARSLAYAGAGHCPGFILNREGHTKATLTSESCPLGLEAAGDFPVSPQIGLEPGDLLFLFTDGIVEAASSGGSGLIGIEGALSIVKEHRHETPDRILDALFRAASVLSEPHGQVDDVTAVIIKVEGPNMALPSPTRPL